MSKQEDKRAKIIAEQLAREQGERAAGRLPGVPAPRSNWAATHPTSPGKRARPKPPRPRPW